MSGRYHPILKCLVLALLFAAGCKVDDMDISNFKVMRDRAKATDAKFGSYIADQRSRIQSLNHRFRDSYARTSDQMAQTFEDELDQQQDMDYVHFADALMLDWKHQTVRSAVYDLLVTRPQELQKRIDDSDKELAAARDAYAQGYQELSDNLDKLESARKDVRALSEYHPERAIASLAKAVASAYQELQKERRESEQEASKSSKGTK